MIKGFLFDVYGMVCDWYVPMVEVIEIYVLSKGIIVDVLEFVR